MARRRLATSPHPLTYVDLYRGPSMSFRFPTSPPGRPERANRPPYQLPNPGCCCDPAPAVGALLWPKAWSALLTMHAQSACRHGLNRLSAAQRSDHARHERTSRPSRPPRSQPRILQIRLAVRHGPANQSTRRLHGAALPRSLTELLVSRGRAECNRVGGSPHRVGGHRHCPGSAIGPER